MHKHFNDIIGLTVDWRMRSRYLKYHFEYPTEKMWKIWLLPEDVFLLQTQCEYFQGNSCLCSNRREAAGTATAMTDDYANINIVVLQNKLKKRDSNW